MKRCRLVAITTSICFGTALFAASLDDRLAEAQKAIQARVENNWNAGIAIGVIDESGTRTAAFGKFNKNSDQKIDADTLFEIGSITKVFTSVILADMAAKGELDISDPVAKFLPATVKVPEKDGKKITLQQLSQHSSGLPRLPGNFAPKNPHDPYADYTTQNMYDYLSGYALTRGIGESYDYSNLGVGLLGHVLALKSGMDYEKLVVSRVCQPLSMKSTMITLSPDLQARLAKCYGESGEPESNWSLPALAGAGALRSSVNDMLRFLEAAMELKSTALSKAFEMTRTVRSKTQVPGLQVGLAWHIISRDGVEVITHSGGTGGYRSFVGFIKDKRIGVVVLTNTAQGVDDIGMHVLDFNFALDKQKSIARAQHKAIKLDSKILDSYTGKFEMAPSTIFTITREGDSLMAELTGQPKMEIFSESESKFFYKVVDAQITFVKDDKSQVTHLILHQNGADVKAYNLKFPRPQRKEVTLEAKILQQYTGEYELVPGFQFTISVEQNALMAQATGQPKVQIYPESETDFFYKVVDAQITFVKDENGKVSHLILHQNGLKQTAKKK